MRALGGSPQPALRIHQERSGSYHLLAFCQSSQDLDAITVWLSGVHLARFKKSVAPVHKHSLGEAGIEHGSEWQAQTWRSCDRQIDADEHVRTESKIFIVGVQTELEGA